MHISRKITLITILVLLLIAVFSAQAGANILIETKYILHNPDEEWHIEDAKLTTVLPGVESTSDYPEILDIKFNKIPYYYITDNKGNQWAVFHYPYIAAGGEKEFVVATLYEEPSKLTEDIGDLGTDMPDTSGFEIWIEPSARIESDAPDIIAKAKDLTEEKKKFNDKVKEIFNWVSSYDLGDADDYENYDSPYANQGALNTYEIIEGYKSIEGEGQDAQDEYKSQYKIVCEDYASLMVAMLRAIDVPARTVAGFKIPENNMPADADDESLNADQMADYRHMWVEVYDSEKNEWFAADPTPTYDTNSDFIDPNCCYIADRYDVVDPAKLKFRSYVELEEGKDFYYTYTLKYTSKDDLEFDEYDNFYEKPDIGLNYDDIKHQDTYYIESDQIGLITLNYRDNTFEQIDSFQWVSTNPTVVKVDDEGFITPVSSKTGSSAIIYAIVNGVKTKEVKVVIDNGEDATTLDEVIMKLEQVTLYPGREFELPSPKVGDIAGSDGPDIRWWVDPGDEGIVSIRGNTLVALREGFATINAELGGVKRKVDVRVLAEAKVAEVVINILDGDKEFLVGKPTQVQVVVYVWGNKGDKTPISTIPAELTAENPEVVEINTVDEEKRIYEVTPLDFEKTILIATARNIQGSLDVVPRELEDDLLINVDKQHFKIDEQAEVTVETEDSGYQELIDTIPLEWDYDDEVIQIEGEGGNYTLTAVGTGTTVLQAIAGNTRSNPVMIVVESPDLENLEIELDDERIKIADTTTLTLVAEGEDGGEYDLTDKVVAVEAEFDDIIDIKPTDDPAVYEVTGLKEGNSRITAKVGGITAETLIEVYKPRVAEVELNVPTNKLTVGEMMEVFVKAYDQDGDEYDLSKSSVNIVISNNYELVDVSNEGYKQIYIEGQNIGAIRLYAEVQGVQSNSENVSIVPASIEIIEIIESEDNILDDGTAQVILGQEIKIKANALDKEGNALDLSEIDPGLEWDIDYPGSLEIEGETIEGNYDAVITVKPVRVGESYVTASVLGIRSPRVKVEVLPEINFTVKNYTIDFSLSKLHMNIGDKVRIAPYDEDESVSYDVYDPGDEVIEVSQSGRNVIIEAVGEGSEEIYFTESDGDKISGDLVIVVGEPGERVIVGELVYDIEEKSMLPSIPEEVGEVPFNDVEGHWAQKDIALAYQMGIISGAEDGGFLPDIPITRAEFATMFARTLGLPIEDRESSFKDLKDHWSKDYVEALHEVGVIGGYGDGTFRPAKNITRAEVAAVIAKALASQSSAEDWFTDLDNASWAEPYINKVAGLGIVNGVGDGKFAPNENTTRAQAVTILMRLLKGLER